jgi:hypothetical protein
MEVTANALGFTIFDLWDRVKRGWRMVMDEPAGNPK